MKLAPASVHSPSEPCHPGAQAACQAPEPSALNPTDTRVLTLQTSSLTMSQTPHLQQQGLEAREAGPDAQINLLASVHGQGISLPGGDQVVHSPGDVCVHQSRKARSANLQAGVGSGAHLYHLRRGASSNAVCMLLEQLSGGLGEELVA